MNSLTHLIRPDLRQFKPYSSARDEAKTGKIWLNANELPWGHEDETLSINRYPEKQPALLLQKLSAIYDVQPDQIALFRGSDEAIDLLTRLFCRAEKDAILICPPTFGMYAVYAKLQGAHIIEVPLNSDDGFQLDIPAIQAAWNPSVKLIYICTPNNPTANNIRASDILQLCQVFADKSIIVVDEAYIEFSSAKSLAAAIPHHENLTILRTFSKAYGLAGARFGALLAQSTLVQWMHAIMAPYPLSSPAIASIVKALSPERLQKMRVYVATIQEQRAHLIDALHRLPVIKKVWPSDANFILVKVADSQQVMLHCVQQGIVLRHMHDKLGLNHCIRISVGTIAENQALLSALEIVYSGS